MPLSGLGERLWCLMVKSPEMLLTELRPVTRGGELYSFNHHPETTPLYVHFNL